MTPDKVCELYSEKEIALKIDILREGKNDKAPLVLLQGSPDSLRMLADLLIAEANDLSGDGFSISPRGAGSSLFDKTSKYGIYIYALR